MKPFDKEKSCQGCPDRTVEPNCHMTCGGYLKRAEKSSKKKDLKNDALRGTREAYWEKKEAIARTKRRLGKKV